MNRHVKIGVLVALVVTLLGALAFTGGTQLQAQTEEEPVTAVGYVNVMEVFESHPEKLASEQVLNDEVLALQSQLEAEIKDMTQEERQKIMQKYQEQLSQREQELVSRVIASIDETIREVADEIGVQIVLEKEQVIYGGQDLTDLVKKRIQEKYGEEQ